MLREFILMLMIMLFGFDNSPKNDLRKKPTKNSRLNNFIQRNFYIAFILMFLCFIVFVIACFTFVGASVESGNYYYHLQDVIQ